MDQLTFHGRTYTDARNAPDRLLMSATAFIGDSLPMTQLAADTLTATVRDYSAEIVPFAAEGLLLAAADGVVMAGALATDTPSAAEYGAAVTYYHDGAPFGRFRLESVARTGKYEYRITCTSDVGLLISSYHYGGVYSGATAGALIAEVIGGIVPYSVDTGLAATTVYGWLPKATRRDNLLRVLFAIGGQIRKDAAGLIKIGPYAEQTPYSIGDGEFYEGGSVAGTTPASEVNVTEHSFIALPTDGVVTLFDGESASGPVVTPKGKTVDGVLVEFSEPVHDLAAENVTILESGANYAVISASPNALLTGKAYSHTQRRITRQADRRGGVPNVINSEDCGLVNLFNAELVADRLMAYYGSAKTVQTDLVVTKQRPGDAVTFSDPFDELTTGYIGSLELTMSSVIRGRAELISGFIPPGSGNAFQHVVTLTSGSSWTVPVECRGRIRVVIVGGGQGGSSGASGAAGTVGAGTGSVTTGGSGGYKSGTGGKGGARGAGGSGGKVLVVSLEVSAGTVFSTSFGVGGAGGVCSGAENTPGAYGTDSAFDSYSSASGATSERGYAEIFSGRAIATTGAAGKADGGDGAGADAEQTAITVGGQVYTSGAQGEADSRSGTNPNGVSWSGTAGGGFGGGPACAANGGAGRSGQVSANNGFGYVDCGSGGNGASATVSGANATVYGGGGQGGCGGGGGGGAAAGTHSRTNGISPGRAGSGGLGSNGGKGGNGCIVIYY